jgi:hypothetical protein
MTYVLNDASALPATDAKTTAKAADGSGFWPRLYAALIESRRRSALRELRAHSFRINESGMLLGGIPTTTLATDEALPFNR